MLKNLGTKHTIEIVIFKWNYFSIIKNINFFICMIVPRGFNI